jgi:hypothetical protein
MAGWLQSYAHPGSISRKPAAHPKPAPGHFDSQERNFA